MLWPKFMNVCLENVNQMISNRHLSNINETSWHFSISAREKESKSLLSFDMVAISLLVNTITGHRIIGRMTQRKIYLKIISFMDYTTLKNANFNIIQGRYIDEAPEIYHKYNLISYKWNCISLSTTSVIYNWIKSRNYVIYSCPLYFYQEYRGKI